MNDQAPARTLFLVGDRFAGFATHEQIVTVDSLVDDMRRGRYHDLPEPLTVQVGQGVDEDDVARVAAAVEGISLGSRVAIADERGSRPLPSWRHVHKRRPQNVLIAGVQKVCDDTFQAALRIHNDNELLLDHQSGLHVQGMVLVEAARQMFLTVSECFYSSRWPDRRYSYLLNSIATRFETPLFPIGATVGLTAERADLTNPAKLDFRVRIEVWQAGRCASSTVVEAVAVQDGRLKALETRLAERALAEALDLKS
jgi:hypothetical protein